MDKRLEEVYNEIIECSNRIDKIKDKNKHSIIESIANSNRLIRFVLPAVLDFAINQDDIETAYPYSAYVTDIQNGLNQRNIIAKIEELIEGIATAKIREVINKTPDMDIQLKTVPNVDNAQFYRFTFESLVDKYKEMYNEEQETAISKELTETSES